MIVSSDLEKIPITSALISRSKIIEDLNNDPPVLININYHSDIVKMCMSFCDNEQLPDDPIKLFKLLDLADFLFMESLINAILESLGNLSNDFIVLANQPSFTNEEKMLFSASHIKPSTFPIDRNAKLLYYE
jgi:hypothetical protein